MDESGAVRLRKCNIQYRKLPHRVQNSRVAPQRLYAVATVLLTDNEELEQLMTLNSLIYFLYKLKSMLPIYASELMH